MSDDILGLPKWLQDKYNRLWKAFESKSFTLEEATKIFENNNTKEAVLVFLSELRKTNWVQVNFDSKDSRKRAYTLKSREDKITEIFTLNDKNVTRADIDRLLKRAADLIRTRVDYRFILVLLFLKRISDKWEMEYKQAYHDALKDGLNEAQAKEEANNVSFHTFDLDEHILWDSIRKENEKLPEKFSKAVSAIVARNPELTEILENIDFVQFASNRENSEILRQLVDIFSEKKLTQVAPDILGDAYEWILRYFAPDKAKEGEVYTPREVINLLVNLLDPHPNESVYDPASASNGMLIMAHKYVKDNYGDNGSDRLFLYGQEANPKTLALGRMNLYIHDIENANVLTGDTLLYPKFKDEKGIKKFDAVIANPPWNQDGYSEDTIKKGEFWKQRFEYGFATKQSADWLWIQHMLASSTFENGRVGVVLDNGCLFRGGKEEAIRSKLLENDFIESIILLPEKLFYNTGAPGVILILRKNKPLPKKGKILFINATHEFEKHPDLKKLNKLHPLNIMKIVKAYNDFADIPEFSKVVEIEKIKEEDNNLNVPKYVSVLENDEKVDVSNLWKEIKVLEGKRIALESKIEIDLRSLGYVI